MPSHEPLLWINGSLLPKHEARVSPSDHGFTVGDGAFETMRVLQWKDFCTHASLERLVRSCESLGIQSPARNEFQSAMETTLSDSGLRDARVRFTVSSGDGPQGSGRDGAAPTMCCMVAPRQCTVKPNASPPSLDAQRARRPGWREERLLCGERHRPRPCKGTRRG